MSEVRDFRNEYLNDIKSDASDNGIGTCATFVNKVANFLIDANVFNDFSESFYNGIGKNNRKIRVDGYFYSEYDQIMNLVIAEFSGDEEPVTLTRTSAIQIFDRAQYFIEEAISGRLSKSIEISTDAADLVDLISHRRYDIRSYRIYLLTDGIMSDRITNIDDSTVDGFVVERQIWDIERIYVNSASKDDEPIEIDFNDFTDGVGIPCIAASVTDNNDYKSYLCIISGSTLADIYDKCGGSRLLESNVRSFLSTKVAVNKKIRETILKCPQNFFAFNNGISATASEYDTVNTDSGCFITHVKNFQIINGGQTTASLSSARYKDKADLSKIFVQMKLTIVGDETEERDSNLVRDISKSSNSQNKVTDADFFSTHPFHIRIEKISRRLIAPAVKGAQYGTMWYYERAKGQLFQEQMRLTKAQKADFLRVHPKKQVISKTDLSTIRNTWDGLPYLVSRGAQTNFMDFAKKIDEDWMKNSNTFNDKYFQESVALRILYLDTRSLVSVQEWFAQAYRANIVTYSIALLHFLIRKQYSCYDLDLMQIWRNQCVPELIRVELKEISKYVFDYITASNGHTMNVTQWCKRKECWDGVKSSCKILLGTDIVKYLISDDENKDAEKAARKDQKDTNNVSSYIDAISIKKDLWQQIFDFSMNKAIGTPEMRSAIRVIISYLTYWSKEPSYRQCDLALQLKELVENEGFKA